jgi:sterol desaturase/sphingolipid hydroxylase (fatty acid hydroxylase superfamily)
MLYYLLVIIAGLFYANLAEWLIHKHLLHNKTSKRGIGWFSFHWTSHHRICRKNQNRDNNIYIKEIISLALILLVHLLFWNISKVFYCTLVYSVLNYYFKHHKSHTDVEWGIKNMPWHYDHHMGLNQDMNWCITRPWFDNIIGTRQKYYGTAKYYRKQEFKRRASYL